MVSSSLVTLFQPIFESSYDSYRISVLVYLVGSQEEPLFLSKLVLPSRDLPQRLPIIIRILVCKGVNNPTLVIHIICQI